MKKILKKLLNKILKKYNYKIEKIILYDYNYNSINHNSENEMNNRFNDPIFMKNYIANKNELYKNILDVVLKLNDSFDNSKIADVGCGPGSFTAMLKKHIKAKKYYGFDFSYAALDYGKNHYDGIEFIKYDIYTKLPSKFDLIICSQTIEHLDDPDKAIANLIDGLNSNGYLILTVPDGRRDTFKGHINFWSPESWKNYLSKKCSKKLLETGVINTKSGNLYAIIQNI